jgi:hypothetical protein
VICVAERTRAGGEPENFIASVSLKRRDESAGQRRGFLRLSAHRSGRQPGWPSWPGITQLCRGTPASCTCAEIGADGALACSVKVAGGAGESIFQPAWSPAGVLHFTSDRSGFANLYRMNSDGTAVCLCAMDAEFATPLWVFGLSTYAWLDGDTLVCIFQKSGFWHLATLASETGQLDAPWPRISPSWAWSLPTTVAHGLWVARPRKPRRSIPCRRKAGK